MYRYNFSVHFFIQENKIVILSGEKKLTVGGSESLYDFLVFCVTNIHISNETLETYSISSAMLALLIQHDVLLDINTYQSGIEAINFHTISHHLTKLASHVDEYYIDELYSKVNDGISKIIDTKLFLQESSVSFGSIAMIKTDLINNESILNLHTTRLLEKVNSKMDLDYLYSAIRYINSKHSDHYIYGSGGGFYSTFSITITSEDLVIIADKQKQVIYQSEVGGIFNQLSDLVLPTAWINAKNYNSIVLLIADTSLILKKYGNKGYKFITMETGVIGFLWRVLYSERGYAEIGGYRYKELLGSIKQFFTDSKDLIVTHLILLVH